MSTSEELLPSSLKPVNKISSNLDCTMPEAKEKSPTPKNQSPKKSPMKNEETED
jgi:hypothetical protein